MLTNFDSKNIHAIFVSEWWPKACLPSPSYSLHGFTFIRNDRTKDGAVGVAFYPRDYMPRKVISISPQPPSTNADEHLFVEVKLHHLKLLLNNHKKTNQGRNIKLNEITV